MNREPRRRTRLMTLLATLASAPAGCQPASIPAAQSGCDPDNGGITLPSGFCAVVVADSVLEKPVVFWLALLSLACTL